MSTVSAAIYRQRLVAGAAIDPWLVGSVATLAGLGAVMVFSTSVTADGDSLGSDFRPVVRHLAAIGLGAVIAVFARWLPPRAWKVLGVPLLVLAVAALLLVLVAGIEVNGSRRWLGFAGVHLQPSEFAKVALVLFLAGYFERRGAALSGFANGVGKVAALTALVCVPIVLEPDLGNVVVLGATVLSMMFLAGVRLVHLGIGIGALLAAGVALTLSAPYRLARVTSFVDPFADPYGSGFQLVQALIAFGRGGWFGTGLGQSVQKLFYLPHASNDFLAAVTAEELGLAGILGIIVLFLVLSWRGFRIALRAARAGRVFEARLAEGATLLIVLQAMIHLGVNMGMLPTKGLTLPFMSLGGSSMLATFFTLGLLLSVQRSLAGGRERGR